MELKHDLDVLYGVVQHNFPDNFYAGICASAYCHGACIVDPPSVDIQFI